MTLTTNQLQAALTTNQGCVTITTPSGPAYIMSPGYNTGAGNSDSVIASWTLDDQAGNLHKFNSLDALVDAQREWGESWELA